MCPLKSIINRPLSVTPHNTPFTSMPSIRKECDSSNRYKCCLYRASWLSCFPLFNARYSCSRLWQRSDNNSGILLSLCKICLIEHDRWPIGSGNPVWLTLTPIPTMADFQCLPVNRFSIKIPAIFRSPTKMSFGHFIFTGCWRSGSSQLISARLMATVNRNWWIGSRKDGFNNTLKVRFLPRSLCQTVPFCPRPAACSTAIITVPSANGVDFDSLFLRYSFVESTTGKVITFCPTNNPKIVLLCNKLTIASNIAQNYNNF